MAFLRRLRRMLPVLLSLWLLLVVCGPEAQATKKNKFKVTYPDGRSEEYEFNDKSCDLIGWQKKVGINVSMKKLRDYQASFGLSVEKIRQLDEVEKDFGLQYEVLCKERQNGAFVGERMKLYDCRSTNVSDALSALRALKITLDGVKEARQADNLKTDVTTLVDKVLSAIPNGFKGNCIGQHLHLGRDQLEISMAESERSIPVINGGQYKIRWWPKTDLPQIYLDPSTGGELEPGAATKLSIYPSPLHGGGNAEGMLVVQDDLPEEVHCKVKLTAAQQQQIKSAIGAVEGKQGQEAVQAAQKAAAWMAPDSSLATQGLFAGELLALSDNGQEAWGVLSKLRDNHPEIAKQAEFQLAWGTSAYKIGDRDTALVAFRSAGANHEYGPLASGYQAYALTAEGKHDQARPYISDFESQPKVSQDSWISRTLQKLFNVFIDDDHKP